MTGNTAVPAPSASATSPQQSADPIPRPLRRFLLALLYFGMFGVAVELFLLEHTEHWQQWIPFGVLAVGFVAITAAAVRPNRLTLLAFRAVMVAFVISGILGIYLHYNGNVVFELEMVPAMKGRELIWNSLKGATPIGAPGFMTQLGLLGLAYTYRHPRLARDTGERV